MERSKILIPVAMLVAALVGAAGFGAVSLLLSGDAGAPSAADLASSSAQERLLRRMAGLEKRVAGLEKRPGLTAALEDEKARDKLVAVMTEARRRDREAVEKKQAAERADRVVAWYRERYERLLASAREAAGVEAETWKQLEPVFGEHFAPVAELVRTKAAGRERSWYLRRGEVNKAVAGRLPATLAAVKKALPAGPWKAFDAWRRQPETSRWGYNIRGEYFLAPGDFKSVQALAATERRWGDLKRELPDLAARLKLEGAKAQQLEALLRKHIESFTAAFDGQPFVNVYDEGNRARIKKLAAGTDAHARKLLGEGAVAAFTEWRKARGRVGIYFGEDVGRGARGGRAGRDRRRRPEGNNREAPPAQPAQPAPGARGEVF